MKTAEGDSSARFHIEASLLFKDTCPELSRFLMQNPVKANAEPKQKSSSPVPSTSMCPHCYQWLLPDHQRVRLRPKRRPSAREQSVLRRRARGKRLSLVQKKLLHRFEKSGSVLGIGQSSCGATPLSTDGFGLLPGLYKAGPAACCVVNTPHVEEQNVVLETQLSKPLAERHLSESEMATFVSMATCHTCNTTSRHRGTNREFLANFAKAHSTPGSTGKHRTPQSTSRGHMNTPKTPGKDKTPAHTPRSSLSSSTSGSGSSSSKSASKPKNWVVQRLSKILLREDNQGAKKGGLKDFLSSL